jgi:hypothetical protein
MQVDLDNATLCELEVLLAVAPTGLAELLPAQVAKWREWMDQMKKPIEPGRCCR